MVFFGNEEPDTMGSDMFAANDRDPTGGSKQF